MKKITVLLLTFFFGLQGFAESQYAYSAVLLDRVIATVNNDVITWSELRKSIEIENREFFKGLTDEEKEKKIKEIESFFLNSMIDMKLQIQEALKLGLQVSPQETNEAVADIKKKYNLTDENFIESLKAEGMSLEEYKTRLSEQILLSKVVRFEVRDTVPVTDKEIGEYYEANTGKYKKEEKVKIRQIYFALKDSSQKAEVEAKAEAILQRIKKGEDFAKLAGEFSEDESRQFGGDLGYVSRGSAIKEIEDEAFALKVGDVSKPFWSPKGLHIIKVEDRKESGFSEKVREEIKEILFEKAFKLKYEDWIKKLREKAYIEINL